MAATRWTDADGLPVDAVRHVLQARDGYLWLATYDGLVRFDGRRFTVFDAGNTPALSSSRVLYVLEAGDGSLWAHTEDGHLTRYRDGAFTPYAPEDHFGGAAVTVYHVDADGTLWVGTEEGLYRFSTGGAGGGGRGERFERVAPATLRSEPVSFYEGERGELWVGTRADGAFRIEGGRLTARTRPPGAPAHRVYGFWRGPDGTLWFRTDRGVGSYVREEANPHVATVEAWVDSLEDTLDVPLQRLRDDASDDLFLYAAGHPGLFDFLPLKQGFPYPVVGGPEGHEWFVHGNVLYQDGEPAFDAAGELSGLTFDYEGNLWLSGAAGLYRLSAAPFASLGVEEGLAPRSANAYGILESRDGAIWTALLSGGVSRHHGGRFTHYRRASGTFAALSLHEDPGGQVWVGYWGGLCRIDPERDRLCRDVEVPGLPDDVPIRGVVRYEGDLWLGTGSGLYRRDEADGTWRRYATADDLSHDHVRVFLQDRRGALWIGTLGGVTRYADGRFTTLTTTDGLSSDAVRALYQDTDGTLWVGTDGRGLNRVELADATGLPQRVVPIRRHDGLFDDGAHQILEDEQGRFWISTNRGIYRVRRADLDAFADGDRPRVFSTAYGEQDGMRDREANGGVHSAGVRARDGRLWFPTQAGLVVVDPATVEDRAVPPPVVIEAVHADDTTVVRPRVLTLPLGVRRLQVEYAAPAYRNPEATAFRYRLVGFDEGWVAADESRTATYTNLPPGRYRFEVVASSAGGVWSPDAAALTVSVPPYFYETGWFALLCGLALLAAAAAAFRWRVRRLRRREAHLETLVGERTREVERKNAHIAQQAERLRELDRAKSRLFANLSHEFRTPLTLTIGPLEDLLGGLHGPLRPDAREPVGLAHRNARRVLALIDQILDVAKLDAHRVRLQARRGDLGAFLATLTQAFAPLAERLRIDLRYEAPDEPVAAYFDPDQLDKVGSNLLSNAFKFTPEGGAITVALDVAEADGRAVARIAVADSGPGIPPEHLPHVFDRFYQAEGAVQRQAGTGIGLALARELAELHGGTVTAESELGAGSTFTVTLPLGRAHLDPADVVEDAEEAPRPGHRAPAALVDLPPHASGDGAAEGEPDEAEDDPAEEDATTVLVVEDNAEVRAYLRRHLEGRAPGGAGGYRIVEAADGEEGIERARALLPDLVVSDVMMPGTDGLALCRALKADPATDFIPVVLLTARAAEEDRLSGLGVGADDYLTKPFSARELVARVDNLIASRKRLRERFRQEAAEADPSLPGHMPEGDLAPGDRAFVEEVHATIEERLADEDFGVEPLAEALGVSRSALYRRLGALLDETPQALIREARLARAARLLETRAGGVGEVAYAVGYRSVAQFSRAFRARHGMPPSAYPRNEVEGGAGDAGT